MGLRWFVPVVALSLAVAPACSDDDGDEGPAATLGSASSTSAPSSATSSTTSTTEPDPYAIPDTIDEAYVERVMNALYGVLGDATRLSMEVNGTPPEVLERIIAVYTNEADDDYLKAATDRLLNNFGGFERPPGDSTADVTEVLAGSEQCILAAFDLDPSAGLIENRSPLALSAILRPADPSRDPQGYNPTPWNLDLVTSAEQDLRNRCES